MQRLLKPTLLVLLTAGCGTDVIKSDGVTPGGGPGAGVAGGSVDGSSATDGVAPVSGGTVDNAANGPVAASPSVDTSCPTTALPTTPLRRLTRFEYKHTVQDLLPGVDASMADDLPADEVTNSFDNNAGVLTVSALHAEKYVLTSEDVAHQAVQNLSSLTTCDPATTGEEACAEQFAQSFGRRAFRRPITADDDTLLMAAYNVGRDGGSYQEGIEVMIRAALQSPHFLYRLEPITDADANGGLVPLDPYELATRLSYLIWGSTPDDALLDAAANGQLSTPEGVAQQARAMLGSPKSRAALTNFFSQWSSLSRLPITTKNSDMFPSYSAEMNTAMAAELPAFLDYMLNSGTSNLTTLLTANVAFVSGPLASVYGVAAPAGSETTPQMVTLPDEQGRSGLLTEAGFMSVQAHPDQTSPVLRGKFVRSMLLCTPPPPPPDNVNVTVPAVDPNSTARERFSAHLNSGEACASCHQLMDPIGFAFENFDALGQYRTTEAGQTIDASGEIIGAPDPNLEGSFVGVRELAGKLAQSPVVEDCMATQMFRFAAGRNEAAGDACSIANLQDAFSGAGGDFVELLVAMTQTDAFLYRNAVTQ